MARRTKAAGGSKAVWLTTTQAASLLGISTVGVLRAIQRQRLKATWFVALDRWMIRSDDASWYHTHRRGGGRARR